MAIGLTTLHLRRTSLAGRRRPTRRLSASIATAVLMIAASLGTANPAGGADPWSEPAVHTFSIVAVDTVEAEWGVAVASRFLAVGSVVPWARAGVGAIATQANANAAFGSYGLDLLERGEAASTVLEKLLATDDEPAFRQLAIVDRHARIAVHTGDHCDGWSGSARGPGFVVIGNALAGPDVVDLMSQAFQSTQGSLAERLLAALQAGETAGGDLRGREAAALLVVKGGGGYRGGTDRLVDLRVDDHDQPIRELARLYGLHAAFYLPAVHVRLGDQALATGLRAKAEREYARVVDLYRKAIATYPGDVRLKNGLAWFYVQHRVNLAEAFRLAEEARSMDPKSWEVVDTLAEIHFARGNFVQAHQHALLALQLDPKNPYLESQAARFQALVEQTER